MKPKFIMQGMAVIIQNKTCGEPRRTMIPKTEQELKAFFMLMDLYEAKKRAELPYTMVTPTIMDMNERIYERMTEDYLKFVKTISEK